MNPLHTWHFYHVYNRGLDGREIFDDNRAFERMMLTIWYYLWIQKRLRLSFYLNTTLVAQQETMKHMLACEKRVELHAFCLMGNHFHLVLKQLVDGGISHYLALIQNSYTRYFNLKHKRTGVLFNTQFKAVLIENDNDLLNVSRYIHLNPLTAKVVADESRLGSYAWSSLAYYLEKESDIKQFVSKDDVMSRFQSPEEYWNFLMDRASYQQLLHSQKQLWLDNF